MEKSPDAFRTISEVADHLETPAHVLRFWESRFPQIRPVKRAGGRRYYRPADVALLSGIRRLLHDEGMTIRGVQKVLREQGVRHVAGLSADAFESAADVSVELVQADPPTPLPQGAQQSDRLDLTDPVTLPPVDQSGTEGSVEPEITQAASENSTDAPPGEVETAAQAIDAEGPLEPESLFRDAFPASAEPPQAESAPGASPAEDPVAAEVGDIWLPALLRAVSPVALARHRAALQNLHDRAAELRDRMASAGRGGRG
jgi:DNA-binding transcriptional MerR regulator